MPASLVIGHRRHPRHAAVPARRLTARASHVPALILIGSMVVGVAAAHADHGVAPSRIAVIVAETDGDSRQTAYDVGSMAEEAAVLCGACG